MIIIAIKQSSNIVLTLLLVESDMIITGAKMIIVNNFEIIKIERQLA